MKKTPLFLRLWVFWALLIVAAVIWYNGYHASRDHSPFVAILVGFGGSLAIHLPLLLWQRHRARS